MIRLLGDLAGTNAGRADEQGLASTVYQGMDAPQIRLPAPLGDVVGVTDIVTKLRAFAANFTNLCHDLLQKIAKLAG